MNAVHEFGNSITKRLPKGETKTVAQQNLGNKTNSQRFSSIVGLILNNFHYHIWPSV